MSQQTERGVRTESGVTVRVEQTESPEYRLIVKPAGGGPRVLMTNLTPDMVQQLRGDGPALTCAAVFNMIEDCLRDWGFHSIEDYVDRISGDA